MLVRSESAWLYRVDGIRAESGSDRVSDDYRQHQRKDDFIVVSHHKSDQDQGDGSMNGAGKKRPHSDQRVCPSRRASDVTGNWGAAACAASAVRELGWISPAR